MIQSERKRETVRITKRKRNRLREWKKERKKEEESKKKKIKTLEERKIEDITLSEIYIEEIKEKMNREKEFMRNSKEGFIKYFHLHTSKQQDKQSNDYY